MKKGGRQSANVEDQSRGQSRTSIAKSFVDQQQAGIQNDISRAFGTSESLEQISKRVTSSFTKSPNFVGRREDNAHSNAAFHAQLRKGF